MHWLSFGFLVLIALLAKYFWVKAVRNLSSTGEAHSTRIILGPLTFAGRQNFTEVGWNYRNWSIAVTVLGVVYALAWVLLGL